MKKFILLSGIVIILIATCSYYPHIDTKTEKTGNSDIGKIITEAPQPTSPTPAFNINSLDLSPQKISETNYVPFNQVEDFNNEGLDFPMDLVNRVGKALYMNDVPNLMTNIDDLSLKINMNDFTIERRTKQYDGSELEYDEVQFYEDLDNGSYNYIIYRFDGDLDDKDEIYMFTNLINTDAGSMQFLILEPNENGEYQFSYRGFYDSRKYISAFQYNGQYYFLFNHEDYRTNTTCSLELAKVSNRKNDYKSVNYILADVFQSIYLKLDQQNADYSLVYENSDFNLTGNIEEYVESIKTDLMQSIASEGGLFYGYENEVENSFIFSADVDNDCSNEMFDRSFIGQDNSLEIRWYKSPPESYYDEYTELGTQPFALQSPNDYLLKQMWFIPINGKTFTFRLFQNENDLRYVLDACLYENKTETHIAVYKIQYSPNVIFVPYWQEYPSDDITEVKLTDPDHDKALGMFSEENYPDLVKKNSSTINKVKYGNENFPSDIVSKIQDGLISSSLETVTASMQEGIETLSEDDFLDETAAYFDKETWQYIDSYNQFDCYKADIDGDDEKEYIVFTSGGTAGFAQFDIYKLKDKKMEDILSQDGMLRGYNSLIHYDGNFYFITDTIDYNTKRTNGAIVFRIFPNGQDKALSIELQTDSYKSCINYNSNNEISSQIDSYITSIKENLIQQNDLYNYQEFIREENTNLSMEEKSRLYSIGGRSTYYKVDYNNDGVDEYYSKYLDYPSSMHQILYLNTRYYKLNDNVEIFTPDYGADGALYQLWYKSFGEKIYTFRLLHIGELLVINVSLLDDETIHQVYTYTLFPQNSLHIEEVDSKELGPKG